MVQGTRCHPPTEEVWWSVRHYPSSIPCGPRLGFGWAKFAPVGPRLGITGAIWECCLGTRILDLDEIKRVADFITSYAETHALILPGRVSSHKCDDILLLPSSCTKADIHRQYQDAMSESELRCVAASTFRNLWLQLLPRIVCSRPMTDLCWECHRNNRDISSSSNLPDVVKQAKKKKQQAHLDLVFMERTFYQNMVKDAKAAYTAAGCPTFGPHPPCSTYFAVHLSFDYAQVHLPSFLMQPGPLYFLVPRKVGIFGVCMEGIPRQVNYLIDESHCSSKGSNAVISYLHHYFETYGLGEKEVHLHCDNCSGRTRTGMSWPTSCGELSQDVTSPSP